MHTSRQNRTYKNGVRISNELSSLIIDSITELGGVVHSGFVPRGVFAKVSRNLKLSKTTVSKNWYLFVNFGNNFPKPKPGRVRFAHSKLSTEDLDYIRDLIVINPTIYRKEIRDLLLQNTNSAFNSVLLTTIAHTVRYRLSAKTSGKPWTPKKTTKTNILTFNNRHLLYTRNFLRHMSTVDPYTVLFLDESGFNVSCGARNYGSSERGSRALHICEQNVRPTYTLFYIGGLMDKTFAKVTCGSSTAYDFVDFIYKACEAFNHRGERIIPEGITLVGDCCSIHTVGLRILQPYLEERNITYYFLPPRSPFYNPIEFSFSYIKNQLTSEYFQTLLEYSVPVAVLEKSSGPDNSPTYV